MRQKSFASSMSANRPGPRVKGEFNVAALTAFETMVKLGREGADAIMALESAGTVNDFVWRSVRMGTVKG